jgi:UDP-N-acetylglucosamine:LPS N-acetylglucosamine transferase
VGQFDQQVTNTTPQHHKEVANSPAKTKVLAVASGGGHWVQLLRITRALQDVEVIYVTTIAGYRSQVSGAPFYLVPDANRWNKLRLVWMAFKLLIIVFRVRPAAVVTTGAAPGYFALRFARWFGAKTVWIDSIANAEELSLSGRQAGKFADLWITQWPHLAAKDGPEYFGAVM